MKQTTHEATTAIDTTSVINKVGQGVAERVAEHPVGGLLGVRYADTLKRADESRGDAVPAQVLKTEERRGLWRALTPQMFRYAALCAALDAAHAAGRFPSDEAQALEWVGASALLIEGAATNLKVTTAADLTLAAAVLRARRGQAGS